MIDEFVPAARYLVVATRSASRFFDLDAVREPLVRPNDDPRAWAGGVRIHTPGDDRDGKRYTAPQNPAGAPPLDWWTVPDLYEPPKGVTMGMATWYQGDALTVLRTLPSGSVDLVMTSPPFLALRSYLPADHPDKTLEIGSEGTPGAFLDVLLDVTEELGRVLAPHGSLVVELGDTYSGAGGMNWDGLAPLGSQGEKTVEYRHALSVSGAPKRALADGWPLAKSLCMIPSTYAWALAYGRNPWTGRTTPAWRVRNLIAWCRPNPPVGALGDKFRPGTSYLTVAAKSGSRYFDLDAVRERGAPGPNDETVPMGDVKQPRATDADGREDRTRGLPQMLTRQRYGDPAGAPPLDWWEIPTHPYPGSHYATFPPQLCVKPIKAMCPQRVCRVCGRPSERITEHLRTVDPDATPHGKSAGALHSGGPMTTKFEVSRETLGWSDCGHDDYRPGIVLDPFAGSGTTLEVATGHGRDAIGIDLDPRNYDLARSRIGMFLTEAEDPPTAVPPEPLANPKYRAGYLRNDRDSRVPAPRAYGGRDST